MIIDARFGVPNESRLTIQNTADGVDANSLYLHVGTFGYLSIDQMARLLTAVHPWVAHLNDRWFVDLDLLAQQIGDDWPVNWRGRIELAPSRVLHGKMNYYGVNADVTQLTFSSALPVVETSMSSKIFLSHKGSDKHLVRPYFSTLKLLGFDPWLDEDALTAGAELERGLLRGFADSCAAVFFVTPAFKDESYLAAEIDYAIAQKCDRPERFQIITLVYPDDSGARGVVPDLLKRYVWKEPSDHLDGLQAVIRALPVSVGPVVWRMKSGIPIDFTWPGWSVTE